MAEENTYKWIDTINTYIPTLNIEEKIEVLNIVKNYADDKHIIEKKTGVQVKYNKIQITGIKVLYDYVSDTVNKKKNTIKNM